MTDETHLPKEDIRYLLGSMDGKLTLLLTDFSDIKGRVVSLEGRMAKLTGWVLATAVSAGAIGGQLEPLLKVLGF